MNLFRRQHNPTPPEPTVEDYQNALLAFFAHPENYTSDKSTFPALPEDFYWYLSDESPPLEFNNWVREIWLAAPSTRILYREYITVGKQVPISNYEELVMKQARSHAHNIQDIIVHESVADSLTGRYTHP